MKCQKNHTFLLLLFIFRHQVCPALSPVKDSHPDSVMQIDDRIRISPTLSRTLYRLQGRKRKEILYLNIKKVNYWASITGNGFFFSISVSFGHSRNFSWKNGENLKMSYYLAVFPFWWGAVHHILSLNGTFCKEFL